MVKLNNLKQARLKKNLTQKQLAEKVNIATRNYQRIESGERKPSYDVLIKLCKLFDIDTINIEQLFPVVEDIQKKSDESD